MTVSVDSAAVLDGGGAPSADRSSSTPSRSRRQLEFGRTVLIRVGRAVLVIIAATMATQWMLERAPGGVAATILGNAASPENIEQLEAELGLDRPFFVRYWEWLTGVVTGDLGRSPVDNRSVLDAIRAALPVTLELVVLGTTIALTLAIVTALFAARRPGGLADRFAGGATSVGLAVPTFVLAPVLLYLFAVRFQWFPVTGWVPLTESVSENLKSAILPALCIALPEFAVFQRLFRGDLVATLDEDFIDAARARGISERAILMRHAFRPASVSLWTVAGISVGRLLGGTVVVEFLFVLPGIGLLLQQSILRRDLIMVQGIVVLLAAAYVTLNLIVDVLYGFVDPRVRAGGGR
jgi:peptide/nickel transport system permease protein